MYPDNEINALSNVYEALKGLNNAQIKRILDWVKDKFDLDKHPGLTAVERDAASTPEASPAEAAEPAVKPLKKRRGRKPGKVKSRIKETMPLSVEPVIKGFMKYDTFAELLFVSNAKTTTAKILLAAAYLQEKRNIKEFSSYDISKHLKDSGQPVSNASIAISSLMLRKPPLLIQTGTFGDSKQSRRKFRVTEEGLRIARNYISE